ncbi:MAG: hypothetical protein PVI80_07925, partial [Anaerolineae bacterium]
MATQAQVNPAVSQGPSRQWLGPLVVGFFVILLVAVVAIALSTATSSTSRSAVAAGIDASAARWQALGAYYASRGDAAAFAAGLDAGAARWQALGSY